jgi:hypothetical protein
VQKGAEGSTELMSGELCLARGAELDLLSANKYVRSVVTK